MDTGTSRFHTVAEVAAVLRVSKMTVYRLVHTGKLDATKVGTTFRIPEAAMRAYLESDQQDSGNQPESMLFRMGRRQRVDY